MFLEQPPASPRFAKHIEGGGGGLFDKNTQWNAGNGTNRVKIKKKI